jgi:LuxR family transcriptional regulator, regulator of acetate metabolism
MEASTVPRERAIAALAELRALLGPDVLQTEGAIEDSSTLEQRVDDGLAALRRMLPGYTGPEAASVAALALELGEIRLMLAGERAARRLDGVVQVQRALARLRAVGSTDQMLAKAPEAVCTYCGFAVAILWRVDEGVLTPVSAFSTRDPGWDDKVRRFCAKFAPIELDAMMLESDMLRRRAPVVVHDTAHGAPIIRDLTQASGIGSYVAAPVMPQGRVIGFPPCVDDEGR